MGGALYIVLVRFIVVWAMITKREVFSGKYQIQSGNQNPTSIRVRFFSIYQYQQTNEKKKKTTLLRT
jgi:hypothetical protein